jgi:hypothetical protein
MNANHPYGCVSSRRLHRAVLPPGLTRRDWLGRNAGALGLLASSGWPTLLSADDAPNEDSVEARVAPLHMNQRPLPAGVPAQLGSQPPGDAGSRVLRIVADLLGVRPVDLAIIDGVDTIKGGEGFWNDGVEAIHPHLLFAGRNAVCTNAVCTATMGYQPNTAHRRFPFAGENHLLWEAEAGLGTLDLACIDVRGLAVPDARFPFKTAPA